MSVVRSVTANCKTCNLCTSGPSIGVEFWGLGKDLKCGQCPRIVVWLWAHVVIHSIGRWWVIGWGKDLCWMLWCGQWPRIVLSLCGHIWSAVGGAGSCKDLWDKQCPRIVLTLCGHIWSAVYRAVRDRGVLLGQVRMVRQLRICCECLCGQWPQFCILFLVPSSRGVI